jgi:hypothetical protein
VRPAAASGLGDGFSLGQLFGEECSRHRFGCFCAQFRQRLLMLLDCLS